MTPSTKTAALSTITSNSDKAAFLVPAFFASISMGVMLSEFVTKNLGKLILLVAASLGLMGCASGTTPLANATAPVQPSIDAFGPPGSQALNMSESAGRTNYGHPLKEAKPEVSFAAKQSLRTEVGRNKQQRLQKRPELVIGKP